MTGLQNLVMYLHLHSRACDCTDGRGQRPEPDWASKALHNRHARKPGRHVIDRRYRLDEVPKALRYLGGGHTKGKIVVILE